MDIQKEREAFLHEFEKTDQYRQQYGFYKIPLRYDEQKEIWNFYDVQAAWEMWQAAKAQAVPEGFVLVPKVATKQMVNAGYEAHDGFFTNGQVQDVYQAMIEAQDSSKQARRRYAL